MKRSILVVAVLILSVSLFSTVGAERAAGQGPAGAGASTASQGNSKSSDSKSGHSLNPIKWVKKDKGSKNSADANGSRSDVEKKLDRKSTRLNSSHVSISYAVFCLKKKKARI